MSTIQRISNKNGVSYRVFVRIKGLRTISKTFPNKQLAREFSTKLEGDRRAQMAYGGISNTTKGAKDSWGCDVHIMQDTQGNVKSVNVQSCSVSNKAKLKSFRDSIERAVNKASPLPSAPDKGVFESELLFYFRVN